MSCYQYTNISFSYSRNILIIKLKYFPYKVKMTSIFLNLLVSFLKRLGKVLHVTKVLKFSEMIINDTVQNSWCNYFI